MPLPISHELPNIEKFKEILRENPGVVIMKFGAEWCGPCKKIERQVLIRMSQMPDNLQSMVIDVDECFEVYAFLKSKRMIKGIPVILAYHKGNLNYIPDDIVVGADVQEVDLFFKRCFDNALSLINDTTNHTNNET